jgi:glycosyltransferase involved in cell wall biosynthesis
MTRSLFVVGALPPPVNGYALVTQAFAQLAESIRDVRCLDTSPGHFARGPAYHLRRIGRLLHALQVVGATPRAQRGALYCPVESGFGLVYTLTLCALARLFGLPIFFHHHSFRYIDQRSRMMSAIVRLSRKGVTHIFLCRCMEQKFRTAYPRSLEARVLSNAGFLDASVSRSFDEQRPLTVGFLSNLNAEKGLYRFLEVASAAHKVGLDIRFVLAGPAAESADAGAIAQARQSLGDALDYRGPVYGEQKTRFYQDIDVFLFPSLYRNEAQPLVLFEATLAGSLVIAIDRGCIAEQIGDQGWVLSPEADFTALSLVHLRALAKNRTALNARRRAIAAAARTAAERARADALTLAASE